MNNVIRLAFRRFGHVFDTRVMSEKELKQAVLLGETGARHHLYRTINVLDQQIV